MGIGTPSQHSIVVDGVTRTYWLYEPANRQPDEALPLLIICHGGGGNADTFVARAGFMPQADARRFVILAPQGLGDEPAWRHSDVATAITRKAKRDAGDDMAFFAALQAQVIPTLNIRPGEVYGTGVSAGGMMLYRVAGQKPGGLDLLGIAVVSSTMTIRPSTAPGAAGTYLFHIHGTSDDRVPFEGGGGSLWSPVDYPPVMDGINHYIAANACPPLARMPDPAPGYTEVATENDQGVCIALRRRIGGEHDWYPESTDMVLDFLIGVN